MRRLRAVPLLLLPLVSACSSTARPPAHAPVQSPGQPVAAPLRGAPAERAIRAAREAQNAAISARDLERVASFWVEDVTVTAGLGAVFRGRDAYRNALERDSTLTYRRTTTRVTPSANWPSAWEEGTWEARRVGWTGVPLMRGRYAAQWVYGPAGWRIRSEAFVALECEGSACSWPFAAVQ